VFNVIDFDLNYNAIIGIPGCCHHLSTIMLREPDAPQANGGKAREVH
jgi:hypothetical protein